jgi:hypothetical protein
MALGALAAAAVLAYVIGGDHSGQQEADEGGMGPLPRGDYDGGTDKPRRFGPNPWATGCTWGSLYCIDR